MKCEHCKKVLHGRKRRFCDLSCCRAAASAKRVNRPKKTCRDCGEASWTGRCKACYAKAQIKNWCVCEWCGETFVKQLGGSRAGKYCCRKHSYDRQSFFTRIIRQQKLYERLLSEVIRQQSKPPIPQRTCHQCGYVGLRKRHRICEGCRLRNTKAEKRRAKAKRRARLRAVEYETVDSTEVFVRDSYQCGICKRRCLVRVAVPHPRAPTLDHIVPLSRGGPHTYANVQCACFQCNTLKSNRMQGQMRLFG